MKLLSAFLSIVTLGVISVQAGNMFGPAPFRNGSPLSSGVDGLYLATMTGTNTTGAFRFAYAQGSQTTNPVQNSWVFFRNGLVAKGTTITNITGSSLSGVLDPNVSSIFDNSGRPEFPMVFVSSDANGAGSFSGNLDLKSPSGAFNGTGIIQNAAPNNITLSIITYDETNGLQFQQVPIPGVATAAFNVPFTFRGVRASFTTVAATGGNRTN